MKSLTPILTKGMTSRLTIVKSLIRMSYTMTILVNRNLALRWVNLNEINHGVY
jgi:hypothetical protein